jgi:hypothetical protein
MYPDELPDPSSIILWRQKYPEFSLKYLQAKNLQSQMLVEQIDDMIPDKIKYYTDANGDERIDAPSASLLIAKINNRKWTAARLAPRTYGNQQAEAQQDSTQDAITKIRDIVAGLNKSNTSEI